FIVANRTQYLCSGNLYYDTDYFTPVSTRTQGGTGVAPGTWTYTLAHDEPNGVTTTMILRPDGLYDVHTFEGWGQKYCGSAWKVGLPKQSSLANGASIQTFTWDKVTKFNVSTYAPNWLHPGYCSGTRTSDPAIYAPVKTNDQLTQDSVTYHNDY